MRSLISLFLLGVFCQSVDANTDDYSMYAGYSADFCDSSDGAICVTHFDELTRGLFKKWGDGIPLSYFDDKYSTALSGLQNFYCAALSDHVNKYKYASIFYDKGMVLIDEYARNNAIRSTNPYKNLDSLTGIIPKFYKSRLINNKEVLKGSVFTSISNVIDTVDVMTEGDMNKSKIKNKMEKSYIENCESLQSF